MTVEGHPHPVPAGPEADEAKLVVETVTMVIQVNGKVRDRIEVPASISEQDAAELALQSEAVRRNLEGQNPRRVVSRPPKLVNLVV